MYRPLLFLLAALLVLPACQTSDSDVTADGATAESGELVIYSGRKQALIEPIVDRFRDETGIDVQARYGSDAEMIAALEEEGDRSQADLFLANTAGALGAARNAGLFTDLPDSLLQMPSGFVPSSGQWVPVTVRFRVLAYDSTRVDPSTLPASVLDMPGASNLAGRIGWTPTYSSFQDFITALRIDQGPEATEAWIEGVQALEPKAYGSNTPMLEALAAGEIDVALTNHYYVLRLLNNAADAPPPVGTHRFAEGDAGNLALVTGAGALGTGQNRESALRFLSFLLQPETQALFAEEVREYPVVRGVDVPPALLSFDEVQNLSPDIDFEELRDLEGTLALLRDEELL
ncbi:MAG: extracellular solute-binding protein [Bacteroidota bacterium]